MNTRIIAIKKKMAKRRGAVAAVSSVSDLSWSDLKLVAKARGVQVSRRKRADIEGDLLGER